MQQPSAIYLIGDIHGQLRTLYHLLQEVHLIDATYTWQGGTACLWFLGDMVDRGQDSIGVLDLVMRLQEEAASVGGEVHSLLGNHELLMLGAYQFGRRSTGLSSNFITKWRHNGGNKADLAKLTKRHLSWLANLPAMALVDDTVLVHADSTFYTRYGNSISEVNETFKHLLARTNALAWEELIEAFAMRGIFAHDAAGNEFVSRFLAIYGGKRIVHGHTPIHTLIGGPAKKVTGPYIYAQQRCINIDGGIYLGGPGFIYQLPASIEEVKNES